MASSWEYEPLQSYPSSMRGPAASRAAATHSMSNSGLRPILILKDLKPSGDGPFDLVGALVGRFGTHPVARFNAVSVFSTDQVVDGLVGRLTYNVPQRLVDGPGDIERRRGAGVE